MTLAVLAVSLAFERATSRGTIGTLGIDAENRGAGFAIVACDIGAGLLLSGAVTAWRGHRGLAAIIPLARVACIGAIGEPIDIASGNSLTSKPHR